MKKTLQQKADEKGVSIQAIWAKTPKGQAYLHSDKVKAYKKAYQKAYKKTDKNKAYNRAYQKTDKRIAYLRSYAKAYYLRKKAEKALSV